MQTLEQQITASMASGVILIASGAHMEDNLNPAFKLRPYQQEAFLRLQYVLRANTLEQRPSQLLFHMATGSGKTLIMAGAILHLYTQGYRNFIFFVNSTNIIDKTRDNFLNTKSSKYLFNKTIAIANKQITVKEVSNFETVHKDDINIVFTTIQGLHARLNTPKENALTYEDFEDKKIVLLSDEAHHINTETKKGKQTSAEQERMLSWESTVHKILHANSKNLLLEFTATIDLQHPEVAKKYRDKLLFDYPLKQFRSDKYSKEVHVLQADLNPFERALQAVLLNQYRRKIFEKNNMHIKPVMLLKSKTINESRFFFNTFVTGVQNLTPETLNKLRNNTTSAVMVRVFNYFEAQKITLTNLILELKTDFSVDKCIAINNKDDSIEKQLIVNSLEDITNEYRAIFAVDKLNEGWDVLNLFDIVRLYHVPSADHKNGSIGKTTMSEAQLIGRGARYCPFKTHKTQSRYQRKYDDDLTNELRICEELYYHAAHNPNYIKALNKALVHIGIKAPETVQNKRSFKQHFKTTDFFKNGVIYVNEQVVYKKVGEKGLKKSIRDLRYNKKLLSGAPTLMTAAAGSSQEHTLTHTAVYTLKNFPLHVKRKALNKLPFYTFTNLKKHFPSLESVMEFLTSPDYALHLNVQVEGNAALVNNLTHEMLLDICTSVFNDVATAIPQSDLSFKGTEKFKPLSIKNLFEKVKTPSFTTPQNGNHAHGLTTARTTIAASQPDVFKEDWYVFNDSTSSSEQKHLVAYIKTVHHLLAAVYGQVYLIRNEHDFKLYTFENGQTVTPDFVLVLIAKNAAISISKQVFITCASTHALVNPATLKSEQFLLEILTEPNAPSIFNNHKFRILGMPVYNEARTKTTFDKHFHKELLNA